MTIRYQSKLRQHGAATLLVSLLILVGATLIVMFSARTSLMEQRISGNEIRTKQAANAAQAGLDEALAYLVAGGRDPSQPFNGNPGGGSSYWTVFWDNNSTLVLDPDNICTDSPEIPEDSPGIPVGHTPPSELFTPGVDQQPIFLIYSCGWSDDSAARQVMMVSARFIPALPNPPSIPLIAHGNVNTNGQARVFNFYNNLTIWSGENFSITGNPGNSFIRNPNEPMRPIDASLPEEPAACKTDDIDKPYVCTTNKDVMGPEIIMGDQALSSLSPDAFFRNFMSGSKDEVRDNSMVGSNLEITAISDIKTEDRIGKSIWVEVPPLLGGAFGTTTMDFDLGTRIDPVILIVNGNLEVKGNINFTGILYVTGNLRTNGNVRFMGATIVEGDVIQAGGTPDFVYDPFAVANVGRLGSMATLPGTWHDWLSAAPGP